MIEEEIIVLNNTYYHLGELVNHSLFKVYGKKEKNILFHDMNQRRLFFILLVDFLSMMDKDAPLIKQKSFLQALKEITQNPNFSINNSISYLKDPIEIFVKWLNEQKKIKVWFPSIDKDIEINIRRIDFIKMAGNISKHNYLRAIGVAKKLQEILKNSNIIISVEEALMALQDFNDRFNEDVLIYLSSHITELLNNIIWGIYDYLLPEFKSSYTKETDLYTYKIPQGLTSKYSQNCYWELMNGIKTKPYIDKFTVSNSFKEDFY